MILAKVVIGLTPVLLFLFALTALDSYKLVSLRSVLATIAVGAGVGLLALFVNLAALRLLDVDVGTFARYIAPVLEEALKAVYVILLIRRGRIAFLVDAAILGFAVGTGFALVENLYYLRALSDGSLVLWFIRGFGTALLHGSTTAVVGIVSKDLSDFHESPSLLLFLPALAAAALLHSLYNHFLLPPLLTTLILLLLLPLIVMVVFSRSERDTRKWLGVGLDSDAEVLELILSGEIAQSRVGQYLESLKSRFPGAVVADMLCLLRVQLELSMRAKGILMAREAGLEIPIADDVKANLEELRYLERSIGKTGRLALDPVLSMRRKDLWQLYLLKA